MNMNNNQEVLNVNLYNNSSEKQNFKNNHKSHIKLDNNLKYKYSNQNFQNVISNNNYVNFDDEFEIHNSYNEDTTATANDKNKQTSSNFYTDRYSNEIYNFSNSNYSYNKSNYEDNKKLNKSSNKSKQNLKVSNLNKQIDCNKEYIINKTYQFDQYKNNLNKNNLTKSHQYMKNLHESNQLKNEINLDLYENKNNLQKHSEYLSNYNYKDNSLNYGEMIDNYSKNIYSNSNTENQTNINKNQDGKIDYDNILNNYQYIENIINKQKPKKERNRFRKSKINKNNKSTDQFIKNASQDLSYLYPYISNSIIKAKIKFKFDQINQSTAILLNRCNEAYMCVSKFQQEIEMNVTLHGSFKNGSFTMDSDIDLVSGVPILNIYNMLSENMSSYILLNKSENHKMNRLILFDSYYGFQLDIVEFKDELTRQTCVLKDNIVKQILSYDSVVITCVWHVKKWHKNHSKFLDTTKGFPNSYILSIVLFFIMMKLKVVPWLNIHNEFDCDFFNPAHYTASEILKTFFDYLGNPYNFEPVQLHNDESVTYPNTGKNWLIVEPSTRTPFQTMRGDIPNRLASLAGNQFTYNMIAEVQGEELQTQQIEDEKDDKALIECYEGRMRDVVRNLRHGSSVIKSMSDKNKKANVIHYIKTKQSSDYEQANDYGLVNQDYYDNNI
eukprot:Mrub_01357.p1 GENE.Mrub_01357~~Mrub_01357.p1  ORF type:complete len:688 (-),score=153.04 Mrub_01357:168-2168(-)